MANQQSTTGNHQSKIGYLVGGGLKENFRVRLTVSSQEIQEGAFVVIASGNWRYYGIVTDIQLGATDPRFADEQMEDASRAHLQRPARTDALRQPRSAAFNLMLGGGPDPSARSMPHGAGTTPEPKLLPVKNVPPHHAEVLLASEGDIAQIFGVPGEKSNFIIGATREQGHPVCIDLDKFVQRSSGVFGATGTGKSFLTRIVLAGLMHHGKASVLVLDMHNEYGFDDTASDSGMKVIGLKTKVRIEGADRRAGRRSPHPRSGPGFQSRDRHAGHRLSRHRAADPRTESQGDHTHHAQRAGEIVRGGLVQPLQVDEPRGGGDHGREGQAEARPAPGERGRLGGRERSQCFSC
jgi:hypothetical protein